MNTESNHALAKPARSLYPSKEPFNSGLLRVSDVHQIYYEESGNPQGKPAVFVHGGPGGGTDPTQRGFFDPDVYRIILFDQRGCGQSLPYASLVDNTTWDLVEDMEKLRKHLNIAKWQVFGGSWGSTLALAYAETHPEAVTELVLRGIFLVRKQEIDWFYQRGASALFPDAWEHYLAAIPEAERGDLVAAYHKRLTSDDPAVQVAAAKAWSIWEGSTSKLHNDPKFVERYADGTFALAFARIECHYFVNKGFMTDGQLLANVDKIRHIPTVIVQGRYDVVCPIESAWALYRALPEADLVIVPDAGHSAKEPGNMSALLDATDRFGANLVPAAVATGSASATATNEISESPAAVSNVAATADFGSASAVSSVAVRADSGSASAVSNVAVRADSDSESADERCVFLDRDGVINVGINVTQASDFQLLDGAKDAIVRLKKAGFKVIVATNQGGLGEKLDGSIHWPAHPLSRKALAEIHARMLELLGDEAKPDAIKVCPHSKSIVCPCRKPLPGMLTEAATEFNINLARSFMVGDRDTDVATGIAAGAVGILVLTGPDGAESKDKDRVPAGTPIFASLKEAADWILTQK